MSSINITELGEDPLYLVFKNLEAKDLKNVAKTCKQFHQFASDNIFWNHFLREKHITIQEGIDSKIQFVNYLKNYCTYFSKKFPELHLKPVIDKADDKSIDVFEQKAKTDESIKDCITKERLNFSIDTFFDFSTYPMGVHHLIEAGAQPSHFHLARAIFIESPLETIRLLLDAGVKSNIIDISSAILNNYPLDIIELLSTKLDAEEYITENDFLEAIRRKDPIKVIQLILEKCPDLSKNILDDIILKSTPDVVKLLLHREIELSKEMLEKVIMLGTPGIITVLVEECIKFPEDTLEMALGFNRSSEVFRILLKSGMKPSQDTLTLARNLKRSSEIFELLLQASGHLSKEILDMFRA